MQVHNFGAKIQNFVSENEHGGTNIVPMYLKRRKDYNIFKIFYRNDDQDQDEESKTSLLHACRKMLKNTKKILARETKTLEITPLKASKSRSSLPGGGQKQTLQLISQ